MQVLRYNELITAPVQSQYDKIVECLSRDDFYSAKVKKLRGTPYYRAELDYRNRVLFKILIFQGVKYALMLEIIWNHAYEKSRFLQGAKIQEDKIEYHNPEAEPIAYLNPKEPQVHIVDKIISFDEIQQAIFAARPPLIIIGSAGSGKTMLTLEHLKQGVNEVLYVTGSPYLVQNARQLYYSYDYTNESQAVDFLSYRELLETIQVPIGKEITFQIFGAWLKRISHSKAFQDANKLYEEFKGVITGNEVNTPYLSQGDYLNLGIKQSIYAPEERPKVYELFEKYQAFLSQEGYYDTNLLSFDYLTRIETRYDLVIVDEVQDFTPIQLSLILKTLKNKEQFILCGDANQIVHPNFFSWAKIKSLFYQTSFHHELIRILNKNYRNALAITTLANKLLKIKRARFGSIDRESHYLVESQSNTPGEVYCLADTPLIKQELNVKTAQSTRFAVMVLHEKDKEEASRYFQTPLIFSIHEAKGLEYDNVILYHLVSTESQKFKEIVYQINPADLEEAFVYSRTKDKSDRSLEVYKFYINALYVAMTRAIQNIYWIEQEVSHPLFRVLELKPSNTLVPIEIQNSSLEEWRKEANRLELQGKKVQAEAIRGQILKTHTPPWTVLTLEELAALKIKALDTHQKNKEARLLLFEYALVYQQVSLLQSLAAIGFGPALKPQKNEHLLINKYYLGYSAASPILLRHLENYGIDFRNVFNQTPLMIASHLGQEILVKQLLGKGANSLLTDNLGRNAFHIMLQKALTDRKYGQKLNALYPLLSPQSLSLQIEGKLVKLDPKQMEFFLVNAMMAMRPQQATKNRPFESFVTQDFLEPLAHFPERIMPEKRKRRSYISSILAKNEMHREGPYNRKLFLRVKLGHYVLNPYLKIRQNEEWLSFIREPVDSEMVTE